MSADRNTCSSSSLTGHRRNTEGVVRRLSLRFYHRVSQGVPFHHRSVIQSAAGRNGPQGFTIGHTHPQDLDARSGCPVSPAPRAPSRRFAAALQPRRSQQARGSCRGRPAPGQSGDETEGRRGCDGDTCRLETRGDGDTCRAERSRDAPRCAFAKRSPGEWCTLPGRHRSPRSRHGATPRHDGPDHLGLPCNELASNTSALIASGRRQPGGAGCQAAAGPAGRRRGTGVCTNPGNGSPSAGHRGFGGPGSGGSKKERDKNAGGSRCGAAVGRHATRRRRRSGGDAEPRGRADSSASLGRVAALCSVAIPIAAREPTRLGGRSGDRRPDGGGALHSKR